MINTWKFRNPRKKDVLIDLNEAFVIMYGHNEGGEIEQVKESDLTLREIVELPIIDMGYNECGAIQGLRWGGVFHSLFTNTGRRYDAYNHGDWF